MRNNRINAVLVSLGKKHRRFVIKRVKLQPLHEVYEVYKPTTLCDYLLKLFVVLDEIQPDFMAKLASKDQEQFQKNISKRRFIAYERDELSLFNKHATKPTSKNVLNYWVVSNLSEKDVKDIVVIACSVAGIRCESFTELHI